MKPRPFASVKAHQDLLEDGLRMRAYRRAIARAARPGDAALDLGCGTGVLSFFAARSGCGPVYAVEREKIVSLAREAAARNGLDGRIVFLKKDVRSLRLPARVDLLVHEQIGSFVWDEDMMTSVPLARRRFLKRGGKILPEGLDLFLVPVALPSSLDKAVAFWSRPRYGLDLGVFAPRRFLEDVGKAAQPRMVDAPGPSCFLTRPRRVHSVDFRRDRGIPSRLRAMFRLRRGGRLTGMLLFFRVRLHRRVSFSTAPRRRNTHWGQVFFPRMENRPVPPGALLEFDWRPAKDPADWRFSFRFPAARPRGGR